MRGLGVNGRGTPALQDACDLVIQRTKAAVAREDDVRKVKGRPYSSRWPRVAHRRGLRGPRAYGTEECRGRAL